MMMRRLPDFPFEGERPIRSSQVSFEIDEKTSAALESLRTQFGAKTNAAVLKRALALAMAATRYADSEHDVDIVLPDEHGENPKTLRLRGTEPRERSPQPKQFRPESVLAPQEAEPKGTAPREATAAFEQPTTGTLIIPHRGIYRGTRVELNTSTNRECIQRIADGKQLLHELDPSRFEEIGAYCWDRDGYEVYLTRGPGDGGRDIVAIRPGVHMEKVIVSVKRYGPNNPVRYDDIRALMGVLSSEQDACRGVLLTSSVMPPLVSEDEFIKKLLPFRLQLMDGADFKKWAIQVALRQV